MAVEIEKIIFGLELDGSAYIKGADSLIDSTKRLTVEQERANKALQVSQQILTKQSSYFQQTKKDLDSYTGTSEKYRLQLEKTFKSAELENQQLSAEVLKNQKAYEAATKAAQDFANTSARAANLQAQTTGGKIPTGPPPAVSAQITSQIAGVLNVADFAKQAQIVEQTKAEFDDLRVSIALADERMKQLNATDEEFQQLAPIVAKGKEAIEQYDNATKGAVGSQVSLRTQLRQGREELVRLEQAGKGATKQYFELEKQVARLTDEFGDQQQRIKILASDTKLLDFGKGAITAATSAFQAFTSISILAGDESEELQKKTMQLFAAMQLLQSLEQLSNLTRREGVLSTLAQSGAQSVYTAVVGASTGALRVFRIALAATGIGAAVVLIALLVNRYNDLKDKLKEAAERQKALLDINKKAIESYADEVTKLKLLSSEYQNSATSLKRKKDIQDELQKSYPAYFKDLDKHADKEKFIAEQIDKVTQALILQAKVQAAQSLLSEKFQDVLKKQFDPTEAVDTWDAIRESVRNFTGGLDTFGQNLATTATKNLSKAQAEYTSFEKFITDFVNKSNAELEKLGGDPTKPDDKTKTDKAIKEIKDDYEERRAALLAEINRLAESGFQTEIGIRKIFDDKLKKSLVELEKDKGLKPQERRNLINLTTTVNTTELDKALEDFRKKQTDAKNKLNDELNQLQDQNAEDSLKLLQNEFDRRAQLIKFNEEKEIVDTIAANQKRLVEFEASSRLIYGQDYETNKSFLARKELLIAAGEQQITNITLKAAQDRADLSADIFQDLLNQYQNAITNTDLIRDKEQADSLKALSEKLLSGKISIEKFNKEVKKIEEFYARDKRERDIVTETAELAALDRKLAAETDKYSDYYKKLKAQRDALDEDLQKKIIANATTPTDDPNKEKTNTVLEYVKATAELADSVVQFWQAANKAESDALDRSIALQEKRVSAAQKIAERGNAQYLKAEEDRLTELNIKRENAARKQLAIDAALQASQILVAITGAITKIANPVTGIPETIGAIAVIIGALATGYGLVKSLQGNQPKLAAGTTELKRRGEPAGVDTIPAWLNEGEAVIPTDKNKKYKKTVEAIYHGKVPADVLNEFVENYVRNNKTSNQSNQNTYESFVNNISKIPTKVLNNFITNYQKENKFFKGTTDVKTKGLQAIPGWLNEGEAIIPADKNRNYKRTVEAIYEGKLPATVINDFAERYVKEKSLTSTVKNVFEQVNDKKITEKQVKDFIASDQSFVNTYTKDESERKAFTLAETLYKLVNHKLNKTENVSVDDVIKYSHITNRVFAENKELVESKNISSLVNKVVNKLSDTSDVKNVSTNKIIKFIDNYARNDIKLKTDVETTKKDKRIYETKKLIESKMVSDYDLNKKILEVQTIAKLVNEKIDKNVISKDFKNSLVNKNITVADVHKYSEIVNKIIENKNTHQKFASNVVQVPDKILSNFINNYEERKFFKGTSELTGKAGIDQIPIWATKGEAIIPASINNLYKPVIKSVFNGTIPPELINNFVSNYHSIKSIPIPDYKRIKESAEIKINSDGRMSVLLSEQNRKLDENNDLQRQTLRAMKSMSVSANIDKDGVAIMVNEYISQMKIDKNI